MRPITRRTDRTDDRPRGVPYLWSTLVVGVLLMIAAPAPGPGELGYDYGQHLIVTVSQVQP